MSRANQRVKQHELGEVVLVPLRPSGFARLVIARYHAPHHAVLGYCFGPVISRPGTPDLSDLHAPKAIYRGICSDLYLRSGRWVRCGRIDPWVRSEWPVPLFYVDGMGHAPITRVVLSDDDPIVVVSCERVHDKAGLLEYTLLGSESLEITLSRLLLPSAGQPPF